MNEMNAVFSKEVYRPAPESNWGGKRLGAGRKVSLENQTLEQIKRYSASTILKILRDKTSDLELRADISTKVILKAMPSQVTSDGSFAPKTVIIMRNERSLLANSDSNKDQNVNNTAVLSHNHEVAL